MDKETLSNYGWIVILVLILSVLLALATPFGNFIAEGFKATYMGLFDTSNNAMEIIIPGSGGAGGGGETGEPGETPNTPIKFYQPYRMSETYEGGFCFVDYVFHEDGSAEIYQYGEEDGIRLCYGETVPAGFLTFAEDGAYVEGEMAMEIGPDGSYVGEPGGDEEYRFNLVPTTVQYLQYGETYVNTEELTYIIFQADGSGTTSTGGGANKLDIPAGSITYQKETFTAFDAVCAVHPEGDKIIMDGLMLEIGCPHINSEWQNETETKTGEFYCKDCDTIIIPSKCKHFNTEIRYASSTYTGDTYCSDCGKQLSWGDTISCQHLNTEVRNASATYTGDTYCVNCGKLLIQGETICVHANTELRNQTDEYTGDTYCKDCGKLIANGDSLLITFYVGWSSDYPVREYKALTGMTWEEWINSKYASKSLYGDDYYICTGNESDTAYKIAGWVFTRKPYSFDIQCDITYNEDGTLYVLADNCYGMLSYNNIFEKPVLGSDVIIANEIYCQSEK